MQQDRSEIQAGDRYDMYARIHKALRLFMFDTLQNLGSAGTGGERRTAALDAVAALLRFCRKHLQHENDFVHPLMERVSPGSSQRIAAEHVHHLKAIAALEAETETARHASGPAAEAALHRLYLHLASFVGENLLHMQEEEGKHNALLWACCSDAELRAVEGAIVASQSPDDAARTMRWMLPAMSHAERLRTLEEARVHAPAPAFAGLLALAEQHLDRADWRKLASALELQTPLAA